MDEHRRTDHRTAAGDLDHLGDLGLDLQYPTHGPSMDDLAGLDPLAMARYYLELLGTSAYMDYRCLDSSQTAMGHLADDFLDIHA
jgi:hypothetical protein